MVEQGIAKCQLYYNDGYSMCTLELICPVCAICINMFSTIFAFSGFTNAMLFTKSTASHVAYVEIEHSYIWLLHLVQGFVKELSFSFHLA